MTDLGPSRTKAIEYCLHAQIAVKAHHASGRVDRLLSGMGQSFLMLASFITRAYFASCARVAVASSSGDEPRIVSPCAFSRSRTSGSASALRTSSFRRAMIGLGVRAGAISANQELNSNPGSPDSDTVGTAGN